MRPQLTRGWVGSGAKDCHPTDVIQEPESSVLLTPPKTPFGWLSEIDPRQSLGSADA